MMKKRKSNILFLLLFLFIVQSCGTLKGSKNLMIADSTPRGQKVYNEKNKYLGTTPFFLKAKPKWRRKFFFRNEKLEVPFKHECATDWGRAFIPDTIMTAINPGLGGVFFVTDYLSGGLWRCSKPMHPTLDQEKFQYSEKKKRILLLPVISEDYEVSQKISSFFQNKIFKKLNDEGAIIVNNDETESDLAKRGLDNYASTHPDNIRREFLNELGHKYDLTHFYYLRVIDKGNYLMVKPELYDAFTVHPVQVKYSKPFKMKKSNSFGDSFLRKIISYIDFLPNSIIAGYSYNPTENREVVLKPTETLKAAKTNAHPNAFPRYITLFLLDTAHHPRFYQPWDIAGFLSPKFGASSWKSNYGVANIEYEFFFESYYAFYDAYFSAFTPMGIFSAGVGLGMLGYFAKDNQGLDVGSTMATFHSFVNYSIFLSDRTYFKISFDAYAPKKDKVKTEYYNLKSWSEVKIGVGYYFPEVKALTRKLLPY